MEPLIPISGMLIPIAGIVMIILIVMFTERRKERQFFHRTELLRKIAESQGDAAQRVLEMIREEEKEAKIRRLEGLKLGGLITAGVGIGAIALLAMLVPQSPVWAAGLIPLLVGAALVIYVVVFAPPIEQKDKGLT